MNIKQAIAVVVSGENLSEKEMKGIFGLIMSGRATPSQVAAFITALRMKGETSGEIAGAAGVMRAKASRIKVPGIVLDTCGTGGSGKHIFNVSTASAFVVAACGVKVAKHGNRAASSRCGSADVLEELGVRLDVPAGTTAECIKEINVGFMFAPLYHGAMKYASGPRRDIGIRTIFNLLGPLSNPAGAKYQVMGVFREDLTPVLARVLLSLGAERAFVVHGYDGLDEISITGPTRVSEARKGRVRTYSLSPRDFGLKTAPLSAIAGGTVKRNASLLLNVLKGKEGPCRDMVLMNAALGLKAAGAVRTIKNGVAAAGEAIDSGDALDRLARLVERTNAFGKGKKN